MLVDTGVSPGRSFRMSFIGAVLAYNVLTQPITANDIYSPSGLTLARQHRASIQLIIKKARVLLHVKPCGAGGNHHQSSSLQELHYINFTA